MTTYVHLWSYLAQFFLGWEMFQTNVVEKIKAHILGPVTLCFFFKKKKRKCRLWGNVQKIVEPGRAQMTI